ncbi:MAG: M23 family metallopeptidase [Bacteroidetes bacterium]|jgi:murein DD-endopeptidase MepM/ murein hydrolase activator NlpD|nr:M23 family metallopeptidase [Bacteroidota bacterium]
MGLLSRIRTKLKETYRFIIVHNETYAQAGNYTFTLGRLLLLSVVAMGLLIVVTSVLIVFTPLREFIPGYTDAQLKREHARLMEDTDRLTHQIARQDSFTLVLQQVLQLQQTDSMLARAEGLLTMPGSTTALGLSGAQANTFVNPVEGKLTKRFHEKDEHFGIDLSAATNATVVAAADGRVIFAEYSHDTGHVIALQHASNTISIYKHNNRLFKKVGSYVLAGEPVAAAGDSGELSTGPHLHFEIWENGKPVDPLKYVSY